VALEDVLFENFNTTGGAGTGAAERSHGVFVMKTPSRMLTAAVSLPWLVDSVLPRSLRDAAAVPAQTVQIDGKAVGVAVVGAAPVRVKNGAGGAHHRIQLSSRNPWATECPRANLSISS
jgi:hypothetical protein